METSVRHRAVAATASLAASSGLAVDDTVVLHDSNRLVVRLLPCNIVARVSPLGWYSQRSEVEFAQRVTAETNGLIAGLDPRLEPKIFQRDDFEISMWTYFEPEPSQKLSSGVYSTMLERLHVVLRQIDMVTPRFTDRLTGVRQWLSDTEVTPHLANEDRELLIHRLEPSSPLLTNARHSEQLLHGEPHPWNVLITAEGPLFIDFENCAQGPVEYDLAWASTEVSDRYPGVDRELLNECRGFVLALVAAHRWRRDDQHPSGRQSGVAFLDVLRAGPPWPALDDVAW